MAKKVCKDCPEKAVEEIKATEPKATRKYSFPSLWLVVEAKNLEELYNSHPLVNNFEASKEALYELLKTIQNIIQ